MKEYSVPALEKAIAILELLAESQQELSVTEIYTALYIPKATTFMVLNVLERHEIVKKNSNGRYTIGMRLYKLGITYISKLDIIKIARPHIEALMSETGFTTHLAVIYDQKVMFIDKVEPSSFVRFTTYPGMRADIHVTSLGKAIAAHLPSDDVEAILVEQGMGTYTVNTITNIADFRQALEQIRQNGYAIENEEGELAVRCIGAPIFDNTRKVVAAVSVTALVSQLPESAFSTVGATVRRTADRISRELGYIDAGITVAPSMDVGATWKQSDGHKDGHPAPTTRVS